tara:strand:+ start:861 stop:2012 length:1152 start_codon:yes stop_codon:yes gene_type:complete
MHKPCSSCNCSRLAYPNISTNDSNNQRRAAAVYPRIQGGLGNQMFVIAAASILANETDRRIVVNSEQTGVPSFGAPQPVFWHTVFHSPYLVKGTDYQVAGADVLDEQQFFDSSTNDFRNLMHSRDIELLGGFIRYDVNIRYRKLLLEIFEPTSEVQRWTNDVALKLGLANREDDVPSSLSESVHDRNYSEAKLARRPEEIQPIITKTNDQSVSWCYLSDPKSCEKKIFPLACKSESCKDNIALHLRLQDSSSSGDYWSQDDLRTIRSYLHDAIQERKERRVVIFSNDLKRARKIMESEASSVSGQMEYSSSLDVVEFFLMSQYFGTHVLTPLGSTFQMWALFLSRLPVVKVLVLPGKIALLEDFKKLPHVIVEMVGGGSVKSL